MAAEAKATAQAGPTDFFFPARRRGGRLIADSSDSDAEATPRARFLRELAAERMSHGFDWIPVKIWEEMATWAATDSVPWDAAWRTTNVPVFVVLGDKDSMQYPDDGRVAYDRSGSEDRTLRVFNDWDDGQHFGHLDLVLGCHAPDHVWPAVEAWMGGR